MKEELGRTLARIEARLSALEAQSSPGPNTRRPPPGELDTPLLEQLAAVRGDADRSGAVRIIGSVRLGESRAAWHVDRGAEELVDVDPEQAAPRLAALAHPVRLSLVQALLPGPCTAAELAEHVGAPSAGKLYHHLDKLVSNSIVTQDRRGSYRLPAAHIVPVLAVFSALIDLGA